MRIEKQTKLGSAFAQLLLELGSGERFTTHFRVISRSRTSLRPANMELAGRHGLCYPGLMKVYTACWGSVIRPYPVLSANASGRLPDLREWRSNGACVRIQTIAMLPHWPRPRGARDGRNTTPARFVSSATPCGTLERRGKADRTGAAPARHGSVPRKDRHWPPSGRIDREIVLFPNAARIRPTPRAAAACWWRAPTSHLGSLDGGYASAPRPASPPKSRADN